MVDLQAHRSFLNRYYGSVHHMYDLTRKYFLWGRDRVLDQLRQEVWTGLVEVGVGTGRNLAKLHRVNNTAKYAGVDASDVMVAHAKNSCPWSEIFHGYAEHFAYQTQLSFQPDRILFSYSLSMVLNREQALRNAFQALAPQGQLIVVDFADLEDAPVWLKKWLHRFLGTFHVSPLYDWQSEQNEQSEQDKPDEPNRQERQEWQIAGLPPPHLEYGPWRYYVIARFCASGGEYDATGSIRPR